MKISKHWVVTFTSSLLATILGILITFGTSKISQNRAKARFVHESEVIAINSISAGILEIRDIQESLKDKMDYLDTVILYYSNKREIPREMYQRFCMIFVSMVTKEVDDSGEKVFSSSSSSWTNRKDIEQIGVINRMFSTITYCRELIFEIYDRLNAIGFRYMPVGAKDYLFDFDYKTAAESILTSTPEIFEIRYVIRTKVLLAGAVLDALEEQNRDAVQALGLKEDELENWNTLADESFLEEENRQ